MAHPIKAKFSSFKSQLSFTFAAPDTRGLRHEKSSCISLTSKNCESPSSWRSSSNPWQFSLQLHEAWLMVGKVQTLGVRLTKRLSKYLEIQMRQTHHIMSDLISWSSREVHQANERVLCTSNKIAQKTSSFYFIYYIIITICKRNISLRDKVFHNYSYFLQDSTKSSSPSTGIKILRVVQLKSMPGYKYPNIDSGATPIGSAGRAPDRKIISRKNSTRKRWWEEILSLWSTTSIRP
jgi:hypothetical protein